MRQIGVHARHVGKSEDLPSVPPWVTRFCTGTGHGALGTFFCRILFRPVAGLLRPGAERVLLPSSEAFLRILYGERRVRRYEATGSAR